MYLHTLICILLICNFLIKLLLQFRLSLLLHYRSPLAQSFTLALPLRPVVHFWISKSIREGSHIALYLCSKCPHCVKVIEHGIVLFTKSLISILDGLHRGPHLIAIVSHINHCHVCNVCSLAVSPPKDCNKLAENPVTFSI